MPTSQSSDLSAALVTPSAGTIAAVGARITSAIAATNGATTTAQSALVAAWYQGAHATCTKAAISGADATTAGACLNTPAAHADEMASLFETNMHYGHGVARIKVQQALAILHDDLGTGIATATRSDIQKDITAHIRLPAVWPLLRRALVAVQRVPRYSIHRVSRVTSRRTTVLYI